MPIMKDLAVYGKYRSKVLICATDFGQALTLARYQAAYPRVCRKLRGPQALNKRQQSRFFRGRLFRAGSLLCQDHYRKSRLLVLVSVLGTW